MKKLPIFTSVFVIVLFFLFYSPFPSFAVCRSPGYDPESDSDINLDILSWEEIAGELGLFPFYHETDPKAPQLSTLIEGNCTLPVNNVNMISGTGVPPQPDIPSDYANMVCLSTPAGQSVLVPDSGYDMGGGCEAVILYAAPNSIVLKYTPDDDIVRGYTVYINNFQVDPNLLAYYNELHESGRTEMPCLSGGEKIGISKGEICVAIRDTGTFMDPRWLEWWQQCPATARELMLKLIDLCLGGVLPPDFFPPGSLTCTPDLVGDQDSRPYYNYDCNLCNLTGLFCPSCATSFTVHNTVSYRRGDGTPEPPHCVETPWDGTVVINPTETKIPFVGKKGEENEQKYLADYFEGTHEYYEDYPMYWRDWINYAGVWRKLSPMGYQDQLKKQMVERALTTSDVQPEGVHHYQLEYRGRICWDMPLLMDAFLAYAESRGIPLIGSTIRFVYERSSYCSFEGSIPGVTITEAAIDAFNAISPLDITYFHTTNASDKITALEGHYPPDPFEEDYAEKWDAWKKSAGGKWYELWQVVPMFSHEDTPGQILPYLGYKSKDEPKFISPEVEKVPHVARLYESTKEISQLLLPFMSEDWQQGEIYAEEKATPIIASAKENVLGEKTLLARAEACQECPELSIANPGVSNGMVYYTYQLCHSCPGRGVIGDVFVGPCGNANQMHNILPSCFSTNHPAIAPPVPISCPGTANVCVAFKCDGCPGCPGQWVTKSCQVTVDESCNITDTNCGAVPVKPAVCGVSGPMPVMECEQEAITDTNENDELCCDPISIDLHAVDAFENPEYDKCREEGITCRPPGCTPGVDCISCHDPCNRLVERSVNRRFGINLLHPYLTDIWNQTGKAETNGLFNIFRPFEISEFQELDASDEIKYSYDDTTDPRDGYVSPEIGKFYFNYLGGVQLSKEWVVNTLLPYDSTGELPPEIPTSTSGLSGFSSMLSDSSSILSKYFATATPRITPEEILHFNPDKNSGWLYIAQTVPEDGITFWLAAVRSLSTNLVDNSAQLLYGITNTNTGEYYSGFLDGGSFSESPDKVNVFYEKAGKKILEFSQMKTDLSEFELKINLPWNGSFYQATKTLTLSRPILYESGDGTVPIAEGVDSLYVSLVTDQGFWIDFQKFNLETSPLQISSRFHEANHRWGSFILNKGVGPLPAGTVGVAWEILDENNQRQPGGYTNIDLLIPGYGQITAEEAQIKIVGIEEIEYWNSGYKTYLKKWKITYPGVDLLFETVVENQENEIMGNYFYEGTVKVFNPETGWQVGTGMLEQTHNEAFD